MNVEYTGRQYKITPANRKKSKPVWQKSKNSWAISLKPR